MPGTLALERGSIPKSLFDLSEVRLESVMRPESRRPPARLIYELML